ncbi:MAG: hypothetical protein GY926_17790 [bacterium]|nr:hypothetical protein [bacterium]
MLTRIVAVFGAAARVAPRGQRSARLIRQVGVAAVVVLVGCGQGESTGVAESGVEPTVASTIATSVDPDAGTGTSGQVSESAGGQAELAPGELMAVIDDPDGYTNVRAGEGVDYDVVIRVVEGDVFYVIPQGGDQDWWPVRTTSGHSGFMHRSRIELVQN